MDLIKSQELRYKRVIFQGKRFCTVIAKNFKSRSYVKRLSKDLYQKAIYVKDGRTGLEIRKLSEEVFEMKQKQPDENGIMRDKKSLRKIFNELGYLINSNFDKDESSQQLFITLTYRENMQDDKKLHRDFKDFFARLKRAYKQHELCYISIVEPQGRGAWHVHLLLKTLNQDHLFIPHEDIERLWGHGATRTERLNVGNIGSYFIAYLSSAPVSDDKIKALEVAPEDIREKDGKKYIKGTRLSMYPDYMQIYRHSRNIKKPVKSSASWDVESAEEIYPDVTYQAYKEIETDKATLKIGKEQRRKGKIK